LQLALSQGIVEPHNWLTEILEQSFDHLLPLSKLKLGQIPQPNPGWQAITGMRPELQ
jgi:hypothetical protein